MKTYYITIQLGKCNTHFSLVRCDGDSPEKMAEQLIHDLMELPAYKGIDANRFHWGAYQKLHGSFILRRYSKEFSGKRIVH